MTQFNYTSGNINNLDSGDSLNMLDIKGPLQDVQTFLNSRTFNEDNLPVSLLQRLGLNDSSGQKGRGKSIITQTESRTNVAYGTLTTPDQVAGIVLPTDGIITVSFRAFWSSTVGSAGRAALFLNSTQLKIPQANVAAATSQEAATGATANINNWLFSGTTGLSGTDGTTFGAEGTDAVTTGLVIGGLNVSGAGGGGHVEIEAAAGTYAVSVQFRATSGTVTVGGRRLRVQAIGF